MFARQTPKIEFLCAPEDFGVIAEPVPAKTVMPDWFRKLPAVAPGHPTASDNGLTVKRCMPFLDAMTTGWIIPLAADVRLEVRDEGRTVEAGWEFDKVMVSNHNSHQVAGHPSDPRPPMKFHNHWVIRTPPGWSTLFVPLLNRPDARFVPVAGVVDTDTYRSQIHFPFHATAPDGVHALAKGTPIVQAIPFRRDTTTITADIRAMRPDDQRESTKILRLTTSEDGWYRRFARARR